MSVVALSAQLASADGADDVAKARALVDQAVDKASAGQYREAIELFREAHKLDHRPEYLCNIGIAYYHGSRYAQAHAYFLVCLEHADSVDEQYIEQVKAATTYIESEMRAGDYAQVEVDVDPKGALVRPTFVDEGGELAGPRTYWLHLGSWEFVVSAPGYETTSQKIVLTTRDRKSIKVVLTREPEPVEPPKPALPKPVDPAPVTPMPVDPGPRVEAPDRTPALISFGVAGALVIGGGVAHGLAYDTRKQLIVDLGEAPRDAVKNSSEARTFRRRRAVAIGLYGLGAVAAGVGAYLWFRQPSRSPVDVEVGSDGAGGSAVMFRWSGEL